MGWYPCCCGRCDPCDCFPCGVRFKLTNVPTFACSSSYLTDDVFNQEWVYATYKSSTQGSCTFEYSTTVDAQPDITVPPGTGPASPPFTCGTCVTSPGIMTVRFEITVYPIANCYPVTPGPVAPPCDDSDFGGSSVCQYCGWQYSMKIYVEPLILGSVTQDSEIWITNAYSVLDPEACDELVDNAVATGVSVCPVSYAETYYIQQINAVLCSSGNPILDFLNPRIQAIIEDPDEYRDSSGQSCRGDAGCACWWQFNPVSPTTAPCTPVTDPSFVNCIDVTYGSGWKDTDWAQDGTIPDNTGHWLSGLNCSNLDTYTVKSVDNTAALSSLEPVPCFWRDFYTHSSGVRRVTVSTDLRVVQASDLRLGNSKDCWDTKGYSCTGTNTWLQEDVALATFSDYKFLLHVRFNPFDNGLPDIGFGEYQWLSQNSFTLSNIWSSGAIAANPLKPFRASAGSPITGQPLLCGFYAYDMTYCIFTDVGSITFPTTYAEEFHCKSRHNIPDVTISPHTPTNC